MGRGGYRAPRDGKAKVSGPGKFSARTDNVPNVGDNDDLEYGDRERLKAAQRIQPVPKTPAPRAGAPRPMPRPSTGASAGMPQFLRDLPSARPDEPVTHGLDGGPGGGPEVLSTPPEPQDDREAILVYLASRYGNPDAKRILNEYRQGKGSAQPTAAQAPLASPTPGEPVSQMDDDMGAMFDDEPMLDEVSAEEPV